jgi:hypothetical protein
MLLKGVSAIISRNVKAGIVCPSILTRHRQESGFAKTTGVVMQRAGEWLQNDHWSDLNAKTVDKGCPPP